MTRESCVYIALRSTAISAGLERHFRTIERYDVSTPHKNGRLTISTTILTAFFLFTGVPGGLATTRVGSHFILKLLLIRSPDQADLVAAVIPAKRFNLSSVTM